MAEQLAVIELPKELQEIQSLNLGLSKDKAEEHLSAFAPFVTTLTELKMKTETINFGDPSEADSKIAREVRLSLAKNRTASEKEKDARKKNLLTEGNLIQAAYNVVANASKMIEESLSNVEKYQELKEKQRIAEVAAKRAEELSQYDVAAPEGIGAMSDNIYASFLMGCKKTYEDKKEAEKLQKEAEERVEVQNKLREQRASSIRPLWGFMNDDELELNLGEMSEEQFKSLSEVLEQRNADHQAEQKRLADELEAERKAAAEAKEKADKERKEAEDKARAEHEAQEAELAKARKEKEEAEAELKRKEAQEAKEKAEAEAKAKEEEKARKAAERKAKNAPDADKLKSLLQTMNSIESPVLKTDEAKELYAEFAKQWGLVYAQFMTKIELL
jgi:hypothetical protein